MTVFVIAHKEYDKPEGLSSCYRTLYVGSNKDAFDYSDGALRDDVGINIADLNSSFCELTGMYWIWKNISDTIKGLCHYRRFFSTSSLSRNTKHILTKAQIDELLEVYDCIVPLKSFTNMPVDSRYRLGHSEQDWNILRQSVRLVSPKYISTFDRVTNSDYFYAANMLIGKSTVFDSYCDWLFPVLFRAAESIDLTGRDEYQARAFGFLSERLFRVWLEENNICFCEQPVLSLHSKVRSRVRMTLDNMFQRPVPRLFDAMTKKAKREGLI